jgi:hypothetical protein
MTASALARPAPTPPDMASGISAAREIDLASWSRAGQFHLFRTYDRPHFATTARVDVTALMTRGKPQGVSPYRAFIHAIGAGVHAVPALKMRFSGDRVFEYDEIALSATVPRPGDTSATPTFPILRTGTSFDRKLQGDHRGNRQRCRSRRQHRPALRSGLSVLPAVDRFHRARQRASRTGRLHPALFLGQVRRGLGWALELPGRRPGPSCAGGRIAGRPVLRGRAKKPRPLRGSALRHSRDAVADLHNFLTDG